MTLSTGLTQSVCTEWPAGDRDEYLNQGMRVLSSKLSMEREQRTNIFLKRVATNPPEN